MGKGNRNRLGRVDTPVESQKATPKAKKSRKPLTKAAKIAVAGFLAILIVAGTVVGALSCNGVFRSRTTVVSGSLNNRNITLSEGVATALLWLNGFKHGSTQVSGAFNLSNGYYFLYSSSSTTNSYAAKVDSYLSDCKTYLRNYPGNAFDNADNQKLLRNYAALSVLADTEEFGISLTKEEKKNAAKNAEEYISFWQNVANTLASTKLISTSSNYSQKNYRADSSTSINEFLTKYVGKNVAKSDVEEAMRISVLYEKVQEEQKNRLEAALVKDGVMDEEKLAAYLASHMEDFYNTEYISYDVTDKAALAEKLKQAASVKAFKELVARDVMTGSYTELYNKYYTESGRTAEDIVNLLKGTFNKNLKTLLGMDYYSEVIAEDIAAGTVKDWLTSSSRKANDMDTVTVDGEDYTVVYLAKGNKTVTENEKEVEKTTYTYALKKGTDAKEYLDIAKAGGYKAADGSTDKILSLKSVDLKKRTDDAASLPEAVKTWITSSSREAGNVNLFVVKDDGIYTVMYLGSETESGKTTYTYATRKFLLSTAPDGVDGDEKFKENLILSALVNLGIVDEDKDNGIVEIYKTSSKAEKAEDELRITAAASILKDMKSQVNSALSTKTKTYVTPKDENDDREELIRWLFTKKTAEECKTDRPEGSTAVLDDNKTAYVIVNPMKLDEDNAVWGGYLRFTGDDRDTKATEAFNKLNGKTGLELWKELQEQSATTKYGFEFSDFTTTTELSKWILSSDRKNGNLEKFSGKEKDTSSSSGTSQSKEIDVTYVAAVLERTVCWKASAFEAMLKEQLEDWVNGHGNGFTVNAGGYATTVETTEETQTK